MPQAYTPLSRLLRIRQTAAVGRQTDDERGREAMAKCMLAQHKSTQRMQLTTFDGAMDEFFSKCEEQRADVHVKAHEKAVLSKLDRIRSDVVRAHTLSPSLPPDPSHCNHGWWSLQPTLTREDA